ncbi:helix-turn-helix domain-containing protein [Saccharothrix longispora]|uniref:Transcriptional regulator with XRE-family HTH domain n=1 Tax=Saccharothrix longispora TaxID=33920 RepID=A0ABU1PSX7_9PSEU|nr:helix-turn-helix transcriptional regulator [Saccharothrix longispora]MDR6593696.1 transcriptional regulator with XRE-family HTH domain [Saccharothrix longispora]
MHNALSENLPRLRKARDLSQEELAAAADVGVDTVGRVERGETRMTRPSTVAKLAKALGVSTESLLGLASADEKRDVQGIATLRRAITATSAIPGLSDFAESSELEAPATLAVTAHEAWRAYVDGHHTTLLHLLPALFVDARRLVHSTSGDDNAVAHRILSTAYRLGAGLVGRFELEDLAWTSAERALAAARESDNIEMETAVSLRYLAWTLVRQRRTADAEQVAVRAAEQIEPRMLDRTPERAGVFGNLIFNAASAALRSGNEGRADDLLAIAQAVAVRAGRDSASEAAIFGPRVAAFQLIDHTMRLGDHEKALRLAERVPKAHGAVPAFWEAGHRLHLAHAASRLRQDRLALAYLAEGRRLAPDWVRRQPLAVKTMRTLVDRAPRRRGKDFGALVAHYGVAGQCTG